MLVSCAIAEHAKGTRIKREPDFPHWTCAHLYQGEIDLRSDRQRLRIAAPSFILIPPRLPYEFTVTIPDAHLWAIFDATPRLANALDRLRHRLHASDLAPVPTLGATIAASMQNLLEWWRADPIRLPLAENALEQALLLNAELTRNHQPCDPRIADVLNFVADNLHTACTVPRMAAVARLSPSRFAAVFQQETGTTPAKHVANKRLERAADLILGTDVPIAEIANAVGYDNPFHFSTRFRIAYGQSPRQFRHNPLRRRFEITPQLPAKP